MERVMKAMKQNGEIQKWVIFTPISINKKI